MAVENAEKRPFMRAKMVVIEVLRAGSVGSDGVFVGQDRIKCAAVAKSGSYPVDGYDEDNSFAKFSPQGALELTIANPALVGKVQPGTKFYLDFTEAD